MRVGSDYGTLLEKEKKPDAQQDSNPGPQNPAHDLCHATHAVLVFSSRYAPVSRYFKGMKLKTA